MFKKDHFLVGFLLGFIGPLFIFGVVYLILMMGHYWIDASFYENMSLLLIAVDGILMRWFMVNRKQDRTGKGMIAAMFVLIFIWVIKYQL